MSDQSITHTVCGKTSHHPRDVSERYCGYCHRFIPAEEALINPVTATIGQYADYIDEGPYTLPEGTTLEQALQLLDLLLARAMYTKKRNEP